MDQQNLPPTGESPAPMPPQAMPTTATSSNDRSFIASFTMAAVAGWTGLRNFYVKQRVVGSIRLALLGVLAILAIVVNFLPDSSATDQLFGVVLFLVIVVISVWSIVDFFMAYFGRKVDAESRPLVEQPGDKAAARRLFIGGLVVPSLMLFVGVAVFIGMMVTQGTDDDISVAQSIRVDLSREEVINAYRTLDTNTTKQQLEASLKVPNSCTSDSCSYVIAVPGVEDFEVRNIGVVRTFFSNDTLHSKFLEDNFVDPGPSAFDEINSGIMPEGTE